MVQDRSERNWSSNDVKIPPNTLSRASFVRRSALDLATGAW
jgi:hypothetical protein